MALVGTSTYGLGTVQQRMSTPPQRTSLQDRVNVGLDWLCGSLVLDEAFKEDDDDLGIDIGGLGSLATITLGM